MRPPLQLAGVAVLRISLERNQVGRWGQISRVLPNNCSQAQQGGSVGAAQRHLKTAPREVHPGQFVAT
jgi:hypothetical protein